MTTFLLGVIVGLSFNIVAQICIELYLRRKLRDKEKGE